VVRCFLFAFSGHFPNAHQLEPESDYAVEDAVEVRVVNNLPVRIVCPLFVSISIPSKAAAYRLLIFPRTAIW
jgi:hypothetical protein